MQVNKQSLQNGDLIGWRRSGPENKGGFYLNLVRVATFSEFGHVSIVWNKGSVPGHFEAVQPKLQHSEIPQGESYAIPLGLNLSDSDMQSFFFDKEGLRYSFRDAILGYLGLVPKEEDRWQCAELSLEFLRHFGLKLPDAHTPSRLMRKTLEYTGKPMFYLHE